MKCNICKNDMGEYARSNKWTFYKCPYCGFYDTEAVQVAEEFNYECYETFDKDIMHYEKLVKDATRILKYKFDLINFFPNSFIDIGCSEGVFVDAYNRLELGRGCGIEVSNRKIERARKRGLNVGSYEDINDKFDFIFSRHVVEHINNSGDYINEIIDKYLKPNGGVICIETPNNDHLGAFKRKNSIRDERFCRELYPPTHVCGYSIRSMKKFAEENNLQIIKMVTYGDSDNWVYPNKGIGFSFKEEIKNKMLLSLNLAVFMKRK